jgi:UPF0288 family protein (methanogenesis marker protein 3)
MIRKETSLSNRIRQNEHCLSFIKNGNLEVEYDTNEKIANLPFNGATTQIRRFVGSDFLVFRVVSLSRCT